MGDDEGRQWTALPDEEKELYYAKTNAMKIKYDEEISEYKKLKEMEVSAIDDKLQELEKSMEDLKRKKEELKELAIPKLVDKSDVTEDTNTVEEKKKKRKIDYQENLTDIVKSVAV